jgi:hypothetical protein
MVSKGSDKFLSDLNPFSIGLPDTPVLFLMLLIMSVVIGVAAVALISHNIINTDFRYIAVNGSLTGIIAIMLPTLLTIMIVKAFKRYVDVKYIFFISIIGTISYSVHNHARICDLACDNTCWRCEHIRMVVLCEQGGTGAEEEGDIPSACAADAERVALSSC